MTKQADQVYQLKITLEGSKPPIWRRVLVDSSENLVRFHQIIQVAMGWDNAHLHQFIHDGKFYSKPSPFDDDMETEDSSQFRVDQLLRREKDWMRYEYDFGDDWLHRIVLEKVLPLDDEVSLPQCVAGKMACPPEDIGGLWGYMDFLAAIKDKNHPEHEDMMEWVGDDEFDPAEFDVDVVNDFFLYAWE